MVVKVIFGLEVNRVFDYSATTALLPGVRVWVDFARRKTIGFVVGFSQESSFERPLKPILEVLDNSPVFSQHMLFLAKMLSERYLCPEGEILKMMLPKALRGRTKTDEDFPRECSTVFDNAHARYIKEEYWRTQRFGQYRCIIEDCLEKNSGVIICVPQREDIAIFTDFLDTFCKNKYCVFFSQQPALEQLLNWKKVRQKQIAIALGTRSCIFSPFDRLGAVIIEKESFYGHYQTEKPFYHVRDVGVLLCQIKKAQLVLSSDTMSVKARMLTKGQKMIDYTVPNTQRIAVLDTQAQKSKGYPLTFLVQEVLRAQLAQKKKVILFWDKKGFSSLVVCNQCGHTPHCPRCSVSLRYVFAEKAYRCPRCSFVEEAKDSCPVCLKGYLRSRGAGIERIVQSLQKIFPEASIAMTEKKDFFQDNWDILVATEKIFYAPGVYAVPCVIVLGIDAVFSRPRFDSAEEGFIVLKRLVSLAREHMYIFTGNPAYYPVAGLMKKEKWFYLQELKSRRELWYPPYGFLAEINLRAKKQAKVLQKAALLSQKMRVYSKHAECVFVSTPQEGQPLKLRGNFYYTVTARAKNFATLRDMILSVWRDAGNASVKIATAIYS